MKRQTRLSRSARSSVKSKLVRGKRLPEWAPSVLIKQYEGFCEIEIQQKKAREDFKDLANTESRGDGEQQYRVAISDLELVERLLTHPDMRAVWTGLPRHAARVGRYSQLGLWNDFSYDIEYLDEDDEALREAFGTQRRADEIEVELLRQCMRIRDDWMAIPMRTNTEHKQLYEEIGRTALRLRRLMARTGRIRQFMSHVLISEERLKERIEAASEEFDIYFGESYYSPYSHKDGTHYFGGYVYSNRPEAFEDSSLERSIFERGMNVFDQFPELLEGVVRHSQARAKEQWRIPKLLSPNAERNYFITNLNEYFTWNFGAPLHEYNAAIVSALLGRMVTRENVRGVLRGREETHARARSRP